MLALLLSRALYEADEVWTRDNAVAKTGQRYGMLPAFLTAIAMVVGKGALNIRMTYGVFQAIGLVSDRVRGGWICHGERGERKQGGRGSNRRVGSLWTLWLTWLQFSRASQRQGGRFGSKRSVKKQADPHLLHESHTAGKLKSQIIRFHGFKLGTNKIPALVGNPR